MLNVVFVQYRTKLIVKLFDERQFIVIENALNLRFRRKQESALILEEETKFGEFKLQNQVLSYCQLIGCENVFSRQKNREYSI